MNFAELTKEQKQYVLLALIAGVTGIFALFNFLLSPMKAKWAAAKVEFAEVSKELDAARRMVRREDSIRESLAESDKVLAAAAAEFLPDSANPLSWATQKIYFKAREVGVEVASVSELGGAGVLQSQIQNGHKAFGSYAVRIISDCNYLQLRNLIDVLEGSNPYLTVSSVSLDAKPRYPEYHGMNITVEWPICLRSDITAKIANKRGKDHG